MDDFWGFLGIERCSDRPSRLRGGADICAARGGAIIGALRRALFWKFELKIGRREDSCDFRVDRGNSISTINYYRKSTTNSVDYFAVVRNLQELLEA